MIAIYKNVFTIAYTGALQHLLISMYIHRVSIFIIITFVNTYYIKRYAYLYLEL